MAEGTYQAYTFRDFSGGWVSPLDRESDSLAQNETPDILNMDFAGKGSVKIRNGFELFSNRISTAGSIIRTHTMLRPIYLAANPSSTDSQIPVRQRGDVLEYYHAGTGNYETLKVTGTLSASRKFGFVNYTSSTDTVDYMYLCDGNVALQRWTGGHTLLNGALAGGEATITVDSTSGFSASGTIYIGTTDVTYTGKTATTFTGCSGTPAAADNAPVSEKAIVFSASAGTKPVGNIMTVWNSQLWVATGQYIKASDVDDFTDWASASSSLATSKGFGGKVTALTSKNDNLIIHTDSGAIYSIVYEFKNDLTGFQLNVDTIEDTPRFAAKVFTGLTRADGEIFFVGLDNVIRRIVQSQVSALYDTGSISENIKNTLALYTMDNASAIFWENKLFFAVQSDEGSINDTVLVFDLKYARTNPTGEAWTKYSLFVSDFFVYNNNLYFGSSASPNCFRLFKDSNNEDITTDDGSAIPWRYSTLLADFDRPELKYRLKKMVARGFISLNCQASYLASYDYGITSDQEVTLIGSDDYFVSVPSGDALGEEVVGEEGGDDTDLFNGAYPFTYFEEFGTIDAYNISMVVSGGIADEKFKLTRLTWYIEPQDDVMTN